MEIRFVVDYRGVYTDEHYYTAGTIVKGLPHANELVKEGRAVHCPPSRSAPQDLKSLSYRELQALAKDSDIAAETEAKKEAD